MGKGTVREGFNDVTSSCSVYGGRVVWMNGWLEGGGGGGGGARWWWVVGCEVLGGSLECM